MGTSQESIPESSVKKKSKLKKLLAKFFMGCSKLEANAIYVLKQASGNDI